MIRFFDLILAVLLLCVFLLPLLAITIVNFASEGSPFFTQKRVGLNGNIFTLIKFRTMKRSTKDLPTHLVTNTALTRLGPFLRSSKIDELPQLINVLLGHMSFVGPRPCLPSQIEVIKEREKQGITDIRPGITGPAQISNIDMSDPVRLAIKDLEWTSDRSLKSYFYLIILTGLGKGRGDNID